MHGVSPTLQVIPLLLIWCDYSTKNPIFLLFLRMAKILRVNNTGDYSSYHGQTDRHPLISVIDYGKVSPIRHSLNRYSVYGIFLHDEAAVDLSYGCGRYDYKESALICVAPGQVGGKEDNGERVNLTGWALLFHPDLLHGTTLEKEINNYSFFEYRINEALHMSREEKDTIVRLIKEIDKEIANTPDDLHNHIIVGYIDVLLRFCQRFYNRQFLTRKLENNDVLARFQSVLAEYFKAGLQENKGLPSIQYIADKLCMSPNYLGDLIKRATGESSGFHIRAYAVQEAKNALGAGLSVSETAYKLGFDYPQHLSRFFKKQTGMTPSEYQKQLK